MRRRHGLALLFALLSALFALNGCGGAENTNSTYNTNTNPGGSTSPGTNVNTITNTSTNTSINTSPIESANTNASERNKKRDTLQPPGPPMSKIDQIKAAMGVGNIAFNMPPSMRLNETQTIMLLLSPTRSAGELEGELRNRNAAGNVERHGVKVSDQMSAELTGEGFQITAITPAQQSVGRLEPTRWKWDVRPLRPGTLKLHVVLHALVDLDDGSGLRREYIDSFDKEYVVEVPSPSPTPAVTVSRARRLWPWLLTALLLPAGGAAAWLWLRARRRRSAFRLFDFGGDASRIFISYRRDDAAGHAGRLRDALVERFGPERVFMDLESIRVGDDFVEVMQKAVGSAGVVIVLIGRQWLTVTDKKGNRRLDNPRDFVRVEVETALRGGVHIIPALVHGAQMPSEEALPESLAMLARRNAVELSDGRWAFDVDRLADAIEEAPERAPAPAPAPDGLPG